MPTTTETNQCEHSSFHQQDTFSEWQNQVLRQGVWCHLWNHIRSAYPHNVCAYDCCPDTPCLQGAHMSEDRCSGYFQETSNHISAAFGSIGASWVCRIFIYLPVLYKNTFRTLDNTSEKLFWETWQQLVILEWPRHEEMHEFWHGSYCMTPFK